MEYFKLTTILFLTLGLISAGYTRPSEAGTSPEDNFYDDDPLQSDDEYLSFEDESEAENNEVTPSDSPPYIETPRREQYAKVGEDAILSCDVKNLGASNVILWYNKTLLMVNHNIVLTPRVQVLENHAIKIRNLELTDTGEYSCQVLPQMINYYIDLSVTNVPLAVYSGERDMTNRSITFRQGDRAEFECRILDIKDAEIKWAKNGKRVEEPTVSSIKNGKIIIEHIDSHHAGTYQCLGDDNSERPHHASITINVFYAPKVSTHRHYVNTEIGDNPKLTCLYKAEPIAYVHWKKDDEYIPIAAVEKYQVENSHHEGHNRTVLHIRNVEKVDTGVYECEANNSLGTASSKVHLIFEPETPQIENMDQTVFGRKVTLQWLVRSKQPLVEAMINYQINGSNNWMTEPINKSEKDKERPHTATWKLTHELELTPGLWHVKVKTKNTEGWSKYSLQHDFIVQENEENSIPEDIIYAADMSGKATNPTNKSNQLIMVPSILVLCLLLSLHLVPSFRKP